MDDWTRVPGIGMIGPDAAARTVESARRAEEAGLGSVWIAEDYSWPARGRARLSRATSARTTA